MNKNVRNLLLLITLIVIPFLVFAYLQMRSLEDDKKRADTIYEKQMETALFSLNQYGDDMMDQWIRRLSLQGKTVLENASNLVIGTESIQLLVLHEISSKKNHYFPSEYVTLTEQSQNGVNTWYTAKDSLMNQLSKYLSAGFQKIQSADDWMAIDGLKPDQSGITVMVYGQDSILYNALFIFEPSLWAEQLLGGKMKEVAQDEFRLAVIQKTAIENQPIIVHDTEPFDLEKPFVEKELWILSDIHLAIQSKGVNYSELIQQRSKTNLYILFFSILSLLIGAFVMIRNIRNALKIAQLKSDFVSNVSHEIRTPLSLIKMYAETLMLGRVPSEERKKQYYEVIHNESGRLAYLVNNILDFSKIEANKKTYSFTKRNINGLVERIYSNYAHTFKEKGIDCELTLDPAPLLANVDEQAFEVALSNLIENAIKFSDKEKNIKINTFQSKGFIFCDVTDQGIGISKSDQHKVFDKFYRVEDALTQKTKGTGLGLSLVKHIIESHKGRVSVKSKPNQGSTFTLTLPLVTDEII